MNISGGIPGTRVFIVDDDKNVADTLTTILRAVGFSVQTFYDALTAFKEAQQNPPDILLSDVVMPGANGITLACKMREQFPRCRTILISGCVEPSDFLDTQQPHGEPALELLEKPISPLDLIAKVVSLNPVGETAVARLAAIVNSSEEAIIGHTLPGVITDWNGGAERLYGYRAEEAIGKNVLMLIPPSQVEAIPEIRAKLLAGERVPNRRMARLRKDGSLVHISLSVSPILSQDGTITGVSSVSHDITHHKMMEEALRKSEERFRLATRATNDQVWDWDIPSGTIWHSETFWPHFGYEEKRPDPTFSGWEELVHSEDRDRVMNGFLTASAQHAESFEAEYRLRRADGSYATVLDRAYIVYDDSGQAIRAIGAVIDISERRMLEEQFRQAQKMETVGQLAGGIAHDFNNLLMVISARAELLLELCPEGQGVKKSMASILSATKSGSQLTRKLLTFSRKQELAISSFDVNELLDEVSEMVGHLLPKSINFQFYRSALPCWIRADRAQIEQAILNLVLNARDAMPDGGYLVVRAAETVVREDELALHQAIPAGNYGLITVADTGTGIPKDIQSRIFDPFFTTKAQVGGSGLGLAMVYGTITQSEGHVRVTSTVNAGTTIAMYLPSTQVQPVDLPKPVCSLRSTHENVCPVHGSVLVVDDEDLIRASIRTFLEQEGLRVEDAKSPQEAIQIAKRLGDNLSMLVTDVVMPGMLGTELASRLRANHANLNVIFMSGYAAGGNNRTTYTSARFLQKPFTRTMLIEAVCAASRCRAEFTEISESDRHMSA